jgi:hypothetical protein
MNAFSSGGFSWKLRNRTQKTMLKYAKDRRKSHSSGKAMKTAKITLECRRR